MRVLFRTYLLVLIEIIVCILVTDYNRSILKEGKIMLGKLPLFLCCSLLRFSAAFPSSRPLATRISASASPKPPNPSVTKTFDNKSYQRGKVSRGKNSSSSSSSSSIVSPDFAKLIARCEETSVYNEAIEAVNTYLQSGTPLTSRTITACIKIFGMAALVDNAIEVLEIARSRNISLNTVNYNALIFQCSRHRRYAEALDAYQSLQREGLSPDAFTYSTMCGVYAGLNDVNSISRLVQEAPFSLQDAIFYASALTAYQFCGAYGKCKELFGETRRRGIVHTPAAFGVMIRLYGKTNVETAYELFIECEKYHTSAAIPKSLVLNMIEILKAAPDESWLRDLKERYVSILKRPDGYQYKFKTASFQEIIDAAKSAGNFTDAVHFADQWFETQKSLSPGGVTSCITIYGLARQPLKAVRVLDVLKERNIAPNVKHFNAVLSVCMKNGMLNETRRIFESMRPVELRDCFTYGIMLSVMEKEGQWEAALNLFNSLPSLNITRTVVMYNTLMSALGKAKQWQKALDVFEDLVQTHTPDRVSILTITYALEASGQIEKAEEIRVQFTGSGSKIPQSLPGGTLQSKLLQQEGGGLFQLLFSIGELNKCLQVLQEAEDSGMTPVSTVNTS